MRKRQPAMSTPPTNEQRRRNIVKAATDLFLSRGYDNTSLGDVQQTLTDGSLDVRRCFPTKTKLLIAVVARLADDYGRSRERELESCRGDALEKIQLLLALDGPSVRRALLRSHANGNVKLVVWLLTALAERLTPILTRLIREGCEEGLFETRCPAEVSAFLFAGLHFLTHRGLQPGEVHVVARRTRALPSIVESLLGAAPGSFSFLSGEPQRGSWREPGPQDG
jgi:AcrR family transcriptional regulator